MRGLTTALKWLALGLALAVVGLLVAGPYEPVDDDIVFDAATLPQDVDGWLADREFQVAALRDGEAKRVTWAGPVGARTPLAVVYVHGFSAGPWEARPLPERVAERLGANLFVTRLTGHGADGAALAEARAGDWLEDMAEAMAVGRRLGDRVMVIGMSMGGTLTTLLAADPALAEARDGLAGVVLISPAYAVANPAARLLSLPAARWWGPVVAGEERSFAPANARHARHWTTTYPTTALMPMQAIVDRAAGVDVGRAIVPALFYFDPGDEVIDHTATLAVAARWSGPASVVEVDTPAGDDPLRHVIAGDILSPAQTPAAIDAIVAWAGNL